MRRGIHFVGSELMADHDAPPSSDIYTFALPVRDTPTKMRAVLPLLVFAVLSNTTAVMPLLSGVVLNDWLPQFGQLTEVV